MRTAPHIALALLAAALMAGCTPGGKEGPPAVALAEVNGEAITVEQLDRRMKLLNLGFENLSAGSDADDAKLETLSQLIDETVCLQEAVRLGISATEKEVDVHVNRLAGDMPPGELDKALARGGLTMDDFRADAARRIVLEKLIESQVYSNLGVDDAKLRRYFAEHRREFRRPLQVHARQIVVESEQEAHEILARLKAGADFAVTAKERSLSPDARMGGDLGYFSKGEMPPEFEETVFGMKPGGLSGVVRTPYGYHIFKVEEVRKAENPRFEEVGELVRKRLLAGAGEDAYIEWQAGLRKKASIKIHTEALNSL